VNTAATLEAVTSDDRAEPSRAAASLSIEGEMARLVRSVRASLHESALRFSPDVQPSGYTVLRSVVTSHPATPAAIIVATGMDKSAVSRQLRILKDLGFVTNVPDPDDRRASLYAPTPLALERMDRVRLEVQADYTGLLDGWPIDDVDQFARLLGEFNDRIERR